MCMFYGRITLVRERKFDFYVLKQLIEAFDWFLKTDDQIHGL